MPLRDAVVPELRSWFAANGGQLVAAYLFGSVARAQERHDSDVDIAVVFGHPHGVTLEDLDQLARWQGELSDLAGRDVDLVALDDASPDLQYRVLVDRILLYEGDPASRIEFEIQARNAYFDLAPLLASYRRAVLRRA